MLRIEYIPLDRVNRWDKNPKRHDLPRMVASIRRYGFRDAVIFDGTLGALVAGHGRALALEAIRNEGGPPPAGIATDPAGAWYLPVQFGNDAPSRAVAEAFALDHNNLTLSGSGLDASLLWDAAGYAGVLRALSEGVELPVTIGADEAARLLGLNGQPPPVEDLSDEEAGEIPDLLAPFPWFGGKSRVAGRIWKRFGEVQNYVEPFCGSAAVLLACPFETPIVTLNDADGFIANFWRAVAAAPEQVAGWVDWPVNEIDLFARHVWLIKRRGDLVKALETDPDYFDAKLAGWWCWGACAWIGTGWCEGNGPWTVEGETVINLNGNAGQGVNRQLPHLGNAGQGVNRQLPHLGDAGRGVNRKLPHLGNAGRGEAITAHLQTYMHRLAGKLRRARVTCGDWQRVTTDSVTTQHGLTAVLLDPPYGDGEQEYSAGGNADKGIARAVWAWAVENGHNPALRIAVCGYDDGRDIPPGWAAMRWKAPKGYQLTETAQENPAREIIWFSPHCLQGER